MGCRATEISSSASLSARYSYIRNSSNADVFDYDRHIVGLYLNLWIGR